MDSVPYVLGESAILETNRPEYDVYPRRNFSTWVTRCGAIRLDLSSTIRGALLAFATPAE